MQKRKGVSFQIDHFFLDGKLSKDYFWNTASFIPVVNNAFKEMTHQASTANSNIFEAQVITAYTVILYFASI